MNNWKLWDELVREKDQYISDPILLGDLYKWMKFSDTFFL